MISDEIYMHRCVELARLGAGYVAPNPLVGAVLVYNNTIIGEGYHRQYGDAHAEVNCIKRVKAEDKALIPSSTLYVSLEPCAHFGKTPPCADLIIENNIKRVVIGCRDPFNQVNGKGIEKLETAGIDVEVNVLQDECEELNKRFFTFHRKKRPFIVLKWAESGNRKIAAAGRKRVLISNDFSNRLVHQWRSKESSILVGTNTAIFDDPALNVRLAQGPDPVRLVVDLNLRLPSSLKIFDQSQRTIIFNTVKHEEAGNVLYYKVTNDVSLAVQISNACYRLNLQSILVEGGAMLLQTFVDEHLWDEARVISNTSLIIHNGLPAPELKNHHLTSSQQLSSDTISYYKHSTQNPRELL